MRRGSKDKREVGKGAGGLQGRIDCADRWEKSRCAQYEDQTSRAHIGGDPVIVKWLGKAKGKEENDTAVRGTGVGKWKVVKNGQGDGKSQEEEKPVRLCHKVLKVRGKKTHDNGGVG